MGRNGILKAPVARLAPNLFYIVSKLDYAILLSIMDEDKRISPRFSFCEPVAYGLPDISTSGSVGGNISLSGISLRVQEFVSVGTIMELQLSLGEFSKVVSLKAEVVRVRQALSDDCHEIGLRFFVDKKATRAISDYINVSRSERINLQMYK